MLTRGTSQLLETQELSDMEFVVLDMTTPSEDHTHNPLGMTQPGEDAKEGVVIPAHR